MDPESESDQNPSGGEGFQDMDEADASLRRKGKKNRQRKNHTYALIRKQMEFYFSDANITKDRLMKQVIQQSEYVELSTFLNFNKISSICKDVENLQRALKHSEKLELSADLSGVKRKVPFDEAKVKPPEQIENCTIYVENLPNKVSHEWIEEVFQQYGPIAYISLPKYKRNRLPKGFAFVEYEEEEGAKRCLEAFGELGACLSTSTDPANLASINTFVPGEEEGDTTDNTKPSAPDNERETQNPEKCAGRETESSSIMESDSQCQVSGSDQVTRGRKRPGVETDEGDCAPKRGKSVNVRPLDAEAKVAESGSENGGPDKAGNGKPEVSDGGEKLTKRQRKRRNRKQKANPEKIKREEKLESESIQLRILPKKHWRQLRNRYLNTQREAMGKLKRELAMKRFVQHAEPEKTTSVCVKVELEAPIPFDVFKAKIDLDVVTREWPNLIKFIDYHEGSSDAIVRLAAEPKGIETFVANANKIFKKATRFSDEETLSYWKSVKAEQILKKKERQKNVRGKDKLLDRAGKINSIHHIRFDDPEEETPAVAETEMVVEG